MRFFATQFEESSRSYILETKEHRNNHSLLTHTHKLFLSSVGSATFHGYSIDKSTFGVVNTSRPTLNFIGNKQQE